mmetsp:Transcript_28630/g.64711  ORF Transcript_28630/g.64711 Transcript_28630/m.64711 type:complete len:204 (-) Transcript_28630:72-683(-)
MAAIHQKAFEDADRSGRVPQLLALVEGHRVDAPHRVRDDHRLPDENGHRVESDVAGPQDHAVVPPEVPVLGVQGAEVLAACRLVAHGGARGLRLVALGVAGHEQRALRGQQRVGVAGHEGAEFPLPGGASCRHLEGNHVAVHGCGVSPAAKERNVAWEAVVQLRLPPQAAVLVDAIDPAHGALDVHVELGVYHWRGVPAHQDP